jgi:hypothetical protein
MDLRLVKFKRDGFYSEATYEGTHTDRKTTLDFQIDLMMPNSGQVKVKSIRGFEHIEAESVPEIFAEIARVMRRMTDSLLHCTDAGVSLPILFKEKSHD